MDIDPAYNILVVVQYIDFCLPACLYDFGYMFPFPISFPPICC